MVVLARKIGKNIIPVVEKFTELELIVKYMEELGVRPADRRAREAGQPRGRAGGEASAGYRSKFGLTLTEVLEAFEYLQGTGLEDCLQMTHFHMGSQVSNIRKVKDALTEAARVYVELYRLGAGLKYIDVGGGLGIDYDGSQTDFESSINYTLQEYANDVVFRIKSVCDEAGVPHPTIISRERPGDGGVPLGAGLRRARARRNFDKCDAPDELPDDAPQPIRDLFANYRDLNKKNYLESYHDAVAGDGGDAEPVQPRLPVDRAAGAGRAAVLGVRPQAAAARAASSTTCRRSCRASTRCCRTRTSATSRCSSRCRTRGRSTSSSRSCRSTG